MRTIDGWRGQSDAPRSPCRRCALPGRPYVGHRRGGVVRLRLRVLGRSRSSVGRTRAYTFGSSSRGLRDLGDSGSPQPNVSRLASSSAKPDPSSPSRPARFCVGVRYRPSLHHTEGDFANLGDDRSRDPTHTWRGAADPRMDGRVVVAHDLTMELRGSAPSILQHLALGTTACTLAANGVGQHSNRTMHSHHPSNRPAIDPLFELDPQGGQVIVTRFECGNLLALGAILALHYRVKYDVRRRAKGFIGVKTLIDWRQRSLLSISLWEDLESVYSMGTVTRHIVATRVPGRIGVKTASAVYCFAGDWRRVMFRSPHAAPRSPLRPLDNGFTSSTTEGD